MKKVVIGFNKKGEPYVISAPKKVEVVFKEPKVKPFKKLTRTFIYHVKNSLAKA